MQKAFKTAARNLRKENQYFSEVNTDIFTPLTPAQYDEAFSLFTSVTTEHQVALDWFQENYLKSFSDIPPKKILSVGCGSGVFDLMLLSAMDALEWKLDYTFLEPNPEAFKQLEFRILNSPLSNTHKFEALPQVFEKMDQTEKFDLIIFAHSLYYFEDKEKILSLALSQLTPGGKLLIFHQTASGAINRIQHFYSSLTGSVVEFNLASEQIIEILKSNAIEFEFSKVDAPVEVTQIFEDSSYGSKLISFFIESNFESLPTRIQTTLLDYIKNLCTTSDSNQKVRNYYLSNPVGVFTVDKC